MTEKMNALRNKKGFTLIEMLVVIAIIAVLVAIVIPVVGSSTDKAAAATNAANLRSLQAEVSTLFLTADKSDLTGTTGVAGSCFTVKQDATSGDVTVTFDTGKAPTFKQVTGVTGSDLAMTYTDNQFVATYGGKTVNDYAYFAEKGEFPGSGT